MSELGDESGLPRDPERDRDLFDVYYDAAQEILERNGSLVGLSEKDRYRQISYLAQVLETTPPGATVFGVTKSGMEKVIGPEEGFIED